MQGLFFVASFSTFVVGLFGFVGTLLGNVFYDVREAVRVVGGTVLKLRLFNLPFLYSDTRNNLSSIGQGLGSALSYVDGMAFAAGWTPCVVTFLGPSSPSASPTSWARASRCYFPRCLGWVCRS